MKATLFLLALFVVGVAADCYLLYPPGSNDRNRERSDNRNNADLLFDSQNNAQGGFPWRGDATKRASDDALTYYSGSNLLMSWTSQHACGPNPNVFCDIILQYGCDNLSGVTNPANGLASNNQFPGLRDGWPDSATLTQSDNNNAGYQRLQFSAETCSGTNNDCQAQNQDGTQRIPANGFTDDPVSRIRFYYSPVGGNSGGIQYPMHEGPDSYDECTRTTRNKGLYVADQTLTNNDARSTRQNPNGGRRGLECPEERDYYPYWRHSDWNDIAVLTTTTDFCPYYQSLSENVLPRYFCDCGQGTRDGSPASPQNTRCNLNQNTASPGLVPIDQKTCGTVGGVWKIDPRSVKGLSAPYCGIAPFGRDNHLGNAAMVDSSGNLNIDPSGQPEAASFNWVIPSGLEGMRCVVRIRYNISTGDYLSTADRTAPNKVIFDSGKSCPGGAANAASGGVDDDTTQVGNAQCINDPKINVNNRPLYNRPYVNVFGSAQPKLSIALNTNQNGRTFQDRSYVFRVAPRPGAVSDSATIWNLNFRGRRGNIVQCYPAVEYDFHPSVLSVTQDDFVHIQFHGSDFNAAKNANNGEGWQYSDRSNLVQLSERRTQFPVPLAQMSLFQSPQIALNWGLLGQDPTKCDLTIKNGDNNEQNNIQNCGKLNQAPNRFPFDPATGLMQVEIPAGTYTYVSTRNNNFSNRSQKGQLNVAPGSGGLSVGAKVAIAFGCIAGVSAAFAGVLFYGKKHPTSAAGNLYNKVSGLFARKTTTAPEMEYQRH